MASSRSDLPEQATPNVKRRILRQSSRAIEAPQHSVEAEESPEDGGLRHERGRRLFEAFDSPLAKVFEGSRVKDIHEARSHAGDCEQARSLLALSRLSPPRRIGQFGASALSSASSSSSSGLSSLSTWQGFTPWDCRGPEEGGPCEACAHAAYFFHFTYKTLVLYGFFTIFASLKFPSYLNDTTF